LASSRSAQRPERSRTSDLEISLGYIEASMIMSGSSSDDKSYTLAAGVGF
jgi:hypothetical protein